MTKISDNIVYSSVYMCRTSHVHRNDYVHGTTINETETQPNKMDSIRTEPNGMETGKIEIKNNNSERMFYEENGDNIATVELVWEVPQSLYRVYVYVHEMQSFIDLNLLHLRLVR